MDDQVQPATATKRSPERERQQNDTYALLDQYKLCVEMSDRLSARRVLTNNSFITMMGAGAFIYSGAPQYFKEGNIAVYFQLGITLGCIVLAVMWYVTILTYRKVAHAKFKVIQEIEDFLPAKPFQMEWKYLSDSDGRVKGFLSLTWIEMCVPVIAGIVAACGFFYTVNTLWLHL